MSWQTIDDMLGLAIIDPAFREELLHSPVVAAKDRGFRLTPDEERLVETIRARDLSEFSQYIVDAKNSTLPQSKKL
ncbi:MAG TPA: Os1348 family NHLP clan protein [Ktedonobacteraceae bacterium]|nr:Os1348 family NHLP clan protein [Ktedonobacteraceae bacterium]